MMEYIDISILNPAEYNPRLLTNEAQEALKESIKELGIIKPIIIRQSDKRIMAGHQRTKTMKLLGYTHVPAFILDGVNSTDEVRFNQLHNYAECELSEIQPEINVNLPKGTEGFYTVSNKDISILSKGGNNSRVVDLTKMILRYGQFANAVCDHTGKVIISTVYAKTVKLLGMDLLYMSFQKGKKKSRSNTSLRNMECSSIPIWNERPIYSLLPKRRGYGKRTGFQASVAIQRCMKHRLYHTSPRICAFSISVPDKRITQPC